MASTALQKWAVTVLASAALAFCPARGLAQAAQTPATPDGPQEDVWDVLRAWRKKPPPPDDDKTKRKLNVTVIPLLSAKPPQGLRLGAGASLEMPFGDPATTRISSLNTGAFISIHGKVGVSASPTFFGSENRWKFEGDDHFQQTTTTNTVLGAGAQSEDMDLNYTSTRFFNAYSHRLVRGLYAGLGLFYAHQSTFSPPDDQQATYESSPFVTYSREHGFDLSSQTAAGLGVGLSIDTRDNQNDAWRGWFVSSSYRAYMKGFLGGDSDWQRVTFDVRTYARLTETGRQRLALWSYVDVVTTGVAPYLSLPMVGGDPRGRTGRGFREGQLRGDRFVYGEAEYRASLMASGLLGMVVFVNASTVGYPPSNQHVFDSVSAAGGAGLRLMLQKRSRTNLCLDFGFGQKGSHGIYLGLSDAF